MLSGCSPPRAARITSKASVVSPLRHAPSNVVARGGYYKQEGDVLSVEEKIFLSNKQVGQMLRGGHREIYQINLSFFNTSFFTNNIL